MLPNTQFPVDLVSYTGEILNGKLYFLYSVRKWISSKHKTDADKAGHAYTNARHKVKSTMQKQRGYSETRIATQAKSNP